MPKIKLTKGELKKQRDNLRQYYRYLPTLQLKKQQLQMEMLKQAARMDEKARAEETKKRDSKLWSALLSDQEVDIKPYLKPASVLRSSRNVAGVDIPVFEKTEFRPAEYDLFLMPLWVDAAIENLRAIVSLIEEIRVLNEGMSVLRQELRITTQRVNLFEKVKIPEAEEAIRTIKIYIGDQMANAVGRSKIAKKKIEEAVAREAVA
jgi:V/A-type H+-transporting ATPase subunit D